jgi:ribosomal protein S27E
MAHFKCVACKTRQYCAAGPADGVSELCPGCGSLLEPVGELAEVFGFRHITSRENVAEGGPPGRHQQIADRVDDFFARREAIVAQARLDAERWIDDGGSFSPEAVAEAVARPTPGENS